VHERGGKHRLAGTGANVIEPATGRRQAAVQLLDLEEGGRVRLKPDLAVHQRAAAQALLIALLG